MKYHIALLDDAGQEIGSATALALRPGSLLIVMPSSNDFLFSDKTMEGIATALQKQLPGQAISVFSVHAEFARLEQVNA